MKRISARCATKTPATLPPHPAGRVATQQEKKKSMSLIAYGLACHSVSPFFPETNIIRHGLANLVLALALDVGVSTLILDATAASSSALQNLGNPGLQLPSWRVKWDLCWLAGKRCGTQGMRIRESTNLHSLDLLIDTYLPLLNGTNVPSLGHYLMTRQNRHKRLMLIIF